MLNGFVIRFPVNEIKGRTLFWRVLLRRIFSGKDAFHRWITGTVKNGSKKDSGQLVLVGILDFGFLSDIGSLTCQN